MFLLLTIVSNNSANSLLGILLLLLAKIQPPLLVSHTFVELGVGFPFEICICIGSLFSFDQK